MRGLHARYRLTGTLKAKSAVHVGGLGPDGAVDLAQVRDGQDRVILPGSSLGGVIRAALDGGDTAWWGKDLTGDRNRDRDASASLVVVSDAVAQGDVILEIRDGVSIDRVTGTAAGTHLFTRYVVPAGTRFDFELTIDVPGAEADPQARGLALQLAGMISGPGIIVGAAVTRGLGEMQLVDAALCRDDLASASGLLALLSDESERIELPGKGTQNLQSDCPAGTLRITVPWRALGPVLSKVADDGGVSDSFPATAAGEDGTLRLLIPGSSLKGVLRSHAERIVRTLTGSPVEGESTFVTEMATAAAMPTIGDAFGEAADHKKGTGRRGLVTVHDVTSRVPIPQEAWRAVRANGGDMEGTIEARRVAFCAAVKALNEITENDGLWFDVASRNAIDRWTGAAADGALYTGVEPYALRDDVWSDLTIDVDLTHARRRTDTPVDALLALMMFLLRDFADGWLPIGFGTTRGLGSVTADPEAIRFSFNGEAADTDCAAELHEKSLQEVLVHNHLTDRMERAWNTTVPELVAQ